MAKSSTAASNIYMQNNSISDEDMSFVDAFRIAVYVDDSNLTHDYGSVAGGGALLRFWIADTAGTGTTIPTPNRSFDIYIPNIVPGEWTVFESDEPSGSGFIDPASINTMGVQFWHGTIKHGRWDGSITTAPIIYIDRLQGNAPLSGYSAGASDAVETPADVIRHWIEVVGGESVNVASLATVATNLSTNSLCGDARGWGTDWISVLDHIAYISRCNIFPSEQSTGLEWKAVCAESDYGWPVKDKTITLFEPENISDVGRDQGNELAAGRTFLYSYSPHAQGAAINGFQRVIRIGSDQNDASTKVAAGIISAATAAFGDIEADPQQLLGICDLTTAQEISSYYYTELARLASIYLIDQLEWSDSYSLEIGDVIEFTLPWASTVTIKARIIEYEKNFDTQLASIRAAGVA